LALQLDEKTEAALLPLLDRISFLSVWIASPCSSGRFLNSEIEGKPTGSDIGTVLIRPVTSRHFATPLLYHAQPGEKIPWTRFIATKTRHSEKGNGHHSIALYLFFQA